MATDEVQRAARPEEAPDRSVGAFVSPASFLYPHRLTNASAWTAHVPFAFWLVEATRPKTIVELGVHTGVSYFAFCQMVERLGLETRCYGVDTWLGDEQTGYYGEEVFADVVAHNERYASFSSLVRSTFDEAVEHFGDGRIDLLNIDGLHTYDAVKHDFETWQPKLSDCGVVLFHDTNVIEGEFGVHRLWAELIDRHPSFDFSHGHGLGVLAVGPRLADPLRRLVSAEGGNLARDAYARLGGSLETRARLDDVLAELDRLNGKIIPDLEERGSRLRSLESELGATREQLHRVHSSRSWRITAPMRWSAKRARALRPTRIPVVPEATREAMRESRLFDEEWYAEEHPDVRGSGVEPLAHFLTHGATEGRNPNRFFRTRTWMDNARKERENVVGFLAGVADRLDDPRARNPANDVATAVQAGRQKIKDGDEICVYAHFDPDAVVDDYVVLTLRALTAGGVKTVFLSSCPGLEDHELAKLAEVTAFAITTRNKGRDFGLYHAGLRFALDRTRPRAVYLLNDSVYGHIVPLEPLLERLRSSDWNLAAATDSHEQRYHLQSYFLRLDEAALEGGFVDDFLNHYVPASDKRYLINAYEIGLSARAETFGLDLGAVWPYRALKLRARQDPGESWRAKLLRPGVEVNPSHFFWDLLLDQGCPFVKIELLRENPSHIQNLREFEATLKQANPAAANTIHRHLARTSTHFGT